MEINTDKLGKAVLIGLFVGLLGWAGMSLMKQQCLCKDNSEKLIGLVTFHVFKVECSQECSNYNYTITTRQKVDSGGLNWNLIGNWSIT